MKGKAAILAIVVTGAMAWLAADGDTWRTAYSFRETNRGYYALLARGLGEGHLYLKADVPAGLLSPDPEVRRHSPSLMDASLYRGRYYLYFGVVPAVFLFLPYQWLTGWDLPENAAAVLLVALGFLLYLRLYGEARRRYFPEVPRPVEVCSLLLLAFGAGTPVLLIGSGVYQIAIAGGYACMAAAWLGIFLAWHSERRAAAWLGSASAALGLAVGCRPNYIAALPMLAVAALLLMRREGKGGARGRLAAAAVLPAGFVGLLLAAYNYGRFGNPLEFGFRYQLSALIDAGRPLARLSFFWPNLKWYYLRPPAFSPYFPYIFPMNANARPPEYYGYEAIQGQLPASLLVLLCGGWLMRLRRSGHLLGHDLRIWFALTGAGFAALFLGMAFFGFRANRYIVDFQASLVLLLSMIGGYCGSRGSLAGGAARGWRGGYCLLAAAVVTANVLTSFQIVNRFEYARPSSYRFLSYYGNYPSQALAEFGLLHYGPIRFKAVFPAVARIAEEPLVATGTPNYTDVLYAAQYPGGQIELRLAHEGYGDLRSGLISIEPGKAHQFEVDLGSLYPPRIHPYFRRWETKDVEAVKTTARVLLDGREVIGGRFKFYDAPPNWVFEGRNRAGIDPAFSGRIFDIRRLQPRDPRAFGLFAEPGVWRLQIEFPAQSIPEGYPVLSSGVAGHGNLLMIEAMPHGQFQFRLDQWGYGMASSPPMEIGGGASHRLEIFVGPRVASQKLPPEWNIDASRLRTSASLLRVWLDGAPVWTTPVLGNQESYDLISIGSNPQGFSTARMLYVGEIKSLPYSPQEMEAFIARNLR
jgi:hypothetical protein